MKKIPNLLLAIASALLLSAGWFAPFTILILFSWVPLLIMEHQISEARDLNSKKLKLIGLVYLCFFMWNAIVCWWIYFASVEGAALAIIVNPMFMTVTFMVWHNLKKRINKAWAVWLIIPIWLAFEHGHTIWDLTWSWIIMGNAFAFNTNVIQWYEFTGTSGGSLWILVVSVLTFNLIKAGYFGLKQIAKPVLAIVIPILISIVILNIRNSPTSQLSNSLTGYKTLIIQPNIDPYNDKFFMEPEIQLHNLVLQLNGKLDTTIQYLVLPETYLTENIFEGGEEKSYAIPFLKDSILKRYPQLTIIVGGSTIHTFTQGEEISSTARKFDDADKYFDYFNSAIQLNKNGIQYYHKSKLVPGVERMPFPALLKPLEGLAIQLGGTFGSLGTQDERGVFDSKNKTVRIAPVICYESAYSDYVSDYMQNGANIIYIITNDGWWSDSPGHKHHLAYAKLRAIENRREIARCANTGISCFITPIGNIEQATPFWKQATIIKNMRVHNELTFYSRFGDLISYTACILAILLLFWSQVLRFTKTKKRAL